MFLFSDCVWYKDFGLLAYYGIQSVAGGNVSIVGGHIIGDSKQKIV
jgi:hypothetical protein